LNALDLLSVVGENGRFQAACGHSDLIAGWAARFAAARFAAAQLAGSRTSSSPGQPLDDILKVGLRIDAVIAGADEQGVHDRGTFSGFRAADEQPILFSHRN
jgi:hypothetical protein